MRSLLTKTNHDSSFTDHRNSLTKTI